MTFLAEKLEDRPRLMPEPSPTVSCSAAPRAAVIRAEPKPSPSPTAAASPTPEKILVKQGDEIVSMALEDYLLGVLAAEMPADFEPEALRAQAVAARSYTLYCAQSGKHHDAQVCTDFGCCQAWKSEEKMQESWGEDFEEKRAKLAGAVEDTAGQYLSYGGEPVFAAFHSSSAGQTEDCGAIWSALPYLKSVESPEGEEDVPGYVSRLELSPLDFRDCLLHASPGTDFSGEESGWIGEVFHEDSGRVDSVMIGGQLFAGTRLRELFSLRSTAFTLEYTGESFLFTVTGFGHGVGMSQYGAQVMAQEGADYADILAHYYPGTVLVA